MGRHPEKPAKRPAQVVDLFDFLPGHGNRPRPIEIDQPLQETLLQATFQAEDENIIAPLAG